MAPYTKLLEKEIRAIAKKYGLEIVRYALIEQGHANTSYLLIAKQGKFILTIFESRLQRVARLCKALHLLDEHGFPSPRVCNLANGDVFTRFRGKPVLLKRYITGQVVEVLNREKIRQAGTAMAQLHEIPTPEFLPDNHAYVRQVFPNVMDKGANQEYTTWLAQRHNQLIQNIPSGLPTGLIHGDLFPDNMLFEGDELKAIIDFEMVCRSYRTFDVGMAVVGLCTDDTRLVLEKARAFVRGYQQRMRLEEKEKESLQLFIEHAAALTSAWRFSKYHIDAPNTQKSRRYLQMVHIAKGVKDIPKKQFMNAVFAS